MVLADIKDLVHGVADSRCLSRIRKFFHTGSRILDPTETGWQNKPTIFMQD
jgi:hypothetical protein